MTGGLLEVLAAATGATRAVEVGTAIGVSTLHLARGGAHVTVVRGRPRAPRRPPRSTSRATAGLSRPTCACRTRRRAWPALDERSFDLAFIDGPKAGYETHLDRCVELLRPGGLLLVDNVLMGGGAATGEPTNQWGQESVDLIRDFNASIRRRDDLRATFLPVGDGVAMAVRR